MNKELHLFIIWGNAQYKKNEILEDIDKKFLILDVINIQWDKDSFSNNISRFYGTKLPSGSFKEIECGTGYFTLVIVFSSNCQYEKRLTSSGEFLVNKDMFDAKVLYRKWTGGGHKIHATNDKKETNHDLMLLLGKSYKSYLRKVPVKLTEINVESVEDKNITGCIQWKSLSELFNVLNETVVYIVLRNFDGMPYDFSFKEHGDIDILVNNPHEVAYLLNAVPVFEEKYRTHYRVNVNYQTIRIDLRYVGDDYYDKKWQQDMLATRELVNGFYVPSKLNFTFSLLYHALIHKKSISADYQKKLEEIKFDGSSEYERLHEFMKKYRYEYTEPIDLSVFFNNKLLNKSISFRRMMYEQKKSFVKYIKERLSLRTINRIKNVQARINKS